MSMIDGDPYDTGTPKYSTPADIYDALREMASGEEIGILSDMYADISWDGQDYYYTDNGYKLVERWEHMTDYGDKMWLMDVAAWQLTDDDANDWIYEILCNDDLAKRIGFKKLFTDAALNGMSNYYKSVTDAFEENLHELDRFGYRENMGALVNAMTSAEWPYTVNFYRNPYTALCAKIYDKMKGLRLDAERQLIVDSRAMLTAYDDFMFGLRANQALYQEQERMYQSKVAQLQAQYDAAKQLLLSMAQEQGVVLMLPDAPLQLA